MPNGPSGLHRCGPSGTGIGHTDRLGMPKASGLSLRAFRGQTGLEGLIGAV